MSKALVIIKSMGIGDLCILISNIHVISKQISQPVTILAQKNTRAHSILKYDPYVEEVIELKDNFIIGTGSNSLIENVRLMKHALENGINRFLLMPPAYYEYSDEGVYSYYANIIERVPECEILLYNFEKLSGYKFSVKIVEKLVKDFPKQIVGVKDSSYNLYENLEIPNFMIFPGSETKLLKGLELGCSGIISAICNVTAPLARKVFDDFLNKEKQTFNEKLCAIRAVFDKNDLITGLHSFMSFKNEKYKVVLPPLSLLSKEKEKEMMSELESLDFFPEKNIAA